jgi:sterol desaturase/sphingolipid hydroxylase (fatty acid hydroxylase superfamily)
MEPLDQNPVYETNQQKRSTTIVLAVLTFLFAMRVAGQLIQAISEIPVVPAFDRWQSGTVSYGQLLLSQFVLIALMLIAIHAVVNQRKFHKAGVILSVLGVVYLLVMTVRAVLGFFELSDNPWFDQPLPTAFHFVIAAFISVLGWYWTSAVAGQNIWHKIPSRIAPVLSYPVTMLFALCLYSWLTREGISQAFSAYLAVALGTAAILIHELLLSYRNIWLPSSRTVTWDVAYLVLVQVLLPAIFSLVVVGGIAYVLSIWAFNPVDFWPHDWPIAVQVVLMMFIADLLRYWLHRASHKVKWLWALHAVHHSPKELYSLNVGRFHPGDKALQFLLDALPFALMGVSQEVLATYFVFYAINGFFQHSNATLHLGPLNWIIAGPELHRWHHAKAYEYSNFNFGNNLIIWDVIFGTRYLPSGAQVGELGIGNSRYPDDLVGQTMAPFFSSPDVDSRR